MPSLAWYCLTRLLLLVLLPGDCPCSSTRCLPRLLKDRSHSRYHLDPHPHRSLRARHRPQSTGVHAPFSSGVDSSQTRLNITEIAMPSASSGPALVAAAVSDDSPAEEKPKEKTIFTVKLEKFDAAAKAKIIREVKAMMPNMNLVEVSPCYRGRWHTSLRYKQEGIGVAELCNADFLRRRRNSSSQCRRC